MPIPIPLNSTITITPIFLICWPLNILNRSFLWQTKFTSKTTGFNYPSGITQATPIQTADPRAPLCSTLIFCDVRRRRERRKCPGLTPARGVEGEKRRPFRSLGCRFLELFFWKQNKKRRKPTSKFKRTCVFFLSSTFLSVAYFFFRWSSSGW